MKKQHQYLLKNTSTAEAQINKISQLLRVEDITNITLALQLLEAGGIPDRIWNRLIALYWVAKHDDTPEEEILANFCQKHLSEVDYQKVDTAYQTYFFYASASKWCELFENQPVENLPSLLDKRLLANELLSLGCRLIAKYCLEHQTMPALEVLQLLMDKRYASLNLRDLELVELPKEIGQLAELRHLYIEGNYFTELPDEIQNLTSLSSLDYSSDGIPDESDTPLSQTAIDKIKHFLPQVWSYKQASRAEILLSKNFPGYESAEIQTNTALGFVEEALTLDPQSCYVWTIKAAHLEQIGKVEESLVCAQEALVINEAFGWPRRILVDGLYQLKKYEDCIMACEPGIDHGKTITKPDYDDAWFLNHFRCSKAEALYQLKQWPEALKAYQKVSIGWRSGFTKGLVAYHTACLYAWAQNKEESLEYLERAIGENKKFIVEAQKELFFAIYKQDKAFVQLLKG